MEFNTFPYIERKLCAKDKLSHLTKSPRVPIICMAHLAMLATPCCRSMEQVFPGNEQVITIVDGSVGCWMTNPLVPTSSLSDPSPDSAGANRLFRAL